MGQAPHGAPGRAEAQGEAQVQAPQAEPDHRSPAQPRKQGGHHPPEADPRAPRAGRRPHLSHVGLELRSVGEHEPEPVEGEPQEGQLRAKATTTDASNASSRGTATPTKRSGPRAPTTATTRAGGSSTGRTSCPARRSSSRPALVAGVAGAEAARRLAAVVDSRAAAGAAVGGRPSCRRARCRRCRRLTRPSGWSSSSWSWWLVASWMSRSWTTGSGWLWAAAGSCES